jgi:hypothetical protein
MQVTHAQIATFLAPAELHSGLDSVHLLRHPHGRPTGEAYVELRDQKSMDFAVQQKHKQMMGRRYIEVRRSRRPSFAACASSGLCQVCSTAYAATLCVSSIQVDCHNLS